MHVYNLCTELYLVLVTLVYIVFSIPKCLALLLPICLQYTCAVLNLFKYVAFLVERKSVNDLLFKADELFLLSHRAQ